MLPYQEERDVAVEAAIRAAHLIRLHAGRLSDDQIQEKSRNNLLTIIDDEAQRLIMSILMEAFPAYGFLAEEETENHAKAGLMRWIIDPIDGTTNFSHGVPPFAVSIALEQEGAIKVGVTLEVTHHELFTAIEGGGFYVNGVRHTVSNKATLRQSLLTTGFPFSQWEHIDAYMAVSKSLMQQAQAVRRTGASVVDLAYVAAGRFDGAFKMGYGPWDVAAGSLMITEAGGVVTDFKGGQDWLFGSRMVASNGLIHEAILAEMEALQDF